MDRSTGRTAKGCASASRCYRFLGSPLLPPVNGRHMMVQVTNTGEGVVSCSTPSNPTIERSLSVRVVNTIWLVLSPCFFNLEFFATKWAFETPWWHHRIGSMLSPVVVAHGLSASKRFPTHGTGHCLTLHARLGMVPPVTLACQHLPTLTTWELFSSMHPHVYHDPVVRLELLPAHRTGGFSPWNAGNLVRYLSHLPALCPFRQILSPKESRHLLLHPPQSPLFDDDLVLSKLHWCWSWSRLGLRSCRQASPSPGYSWCRLQSLSLVLAGETYIPFILSV